MKSFKLLLFSLLSIALAASSCSKDEVNNEKGEFGIIKFDRERIGTGQYVTASCQLPSSNGENVGYKWSSPSIFKFTTEEKNGISYATFLIPYGTTGTIEIELNDEYNSLTPATAEINVEETDIYNSFWGDNIDFTLKNRPELKLENDGLYYGTISEYIKNTLSESYSGIYTFDNDKLVKVDEIRNFYGNEELVYAFVKEYNLIIKKTLDRYGLDVSESYIEYTDNTKDVYDYNSTDNVYLENIFDEIIIGNAKVYVSAHNDKTDVTFYAVKSTENTIFYVSEYTPRNQ